MPSQRIADAAHVAPYLTHDIPHHGRATLTPPDKVRQAKPKKSRQKQERNARSEEDMKFDTGPRPLRNLVANRGARRQGRTGRQDRGHYNDGNEDAYPDYPPPTFLEAISTPPLSVGPRTTTPVTMLQPLITSRQQSPPEFLSQPPSPSITSVLLQSSEPPGSSRRNSEIDTDDSLEIIEIDSVQAQIENDRSGSGQRAKERYGSESPGTPRGRMKSRRPAILDSDSDDNGEVTQSPQAKAKRKLSLSPLRTLFPYQPMVAQDRALSAHPSRNNSPYSSRSSFPFLSTTSLKMSMSTSSFLKFPTTPTTPRSESFVSRKFSFLKGRERARSESLDTWEIVRSELPDPIEEPTTPTSPIQDQNRGSSAPNIALVESESNLAANNAGTHPLSLRDRKAPPVPRVGVAVRRPPPLPPVRQVPPVFDSVVTPTAPVSQIPMVSNVHSRQRNTSPTPKSSKPQVMCASPLGANRWRAAGDADDPLPSIFQRALETPLPSSPVEHMHPQPADVVPATFPDTPTPHESIFLSNITRSPSRTPPLPRKSPSGATTTPEASGLFAADPPLPPTQIARGPSEDSDATSARHYPGRPLPRPPGPSRTLIDSTYAGHTEFQFHGNICPDGLLIDLDDTSLSESFTSGTSTPQSGAGRYGKPIQLSAAPSTSSASSMELVEPMPEVSSSQGHNSLRSAARPSVPAQFLEVTDLDVLISRLHEEQHQGSDHEALLMLTDFMGPATPVRTAARPHSFSSISDNGMDSGINIPLLGDVEVERRRKTKDGRVKLKLVLLDSPVDKCGICLMQFRGNNVARLGSVCRHAFHDRCLGRWLVRSKTCPLCRLPFADQV